MSDARVLPPPLSPPVGAASPRRGESVATALATLRGGIEALCARGLGQLDDEEQRSEQAAQAPRLAAAAGTLAAALTRIGTQRDGQRPVRGPVPGAGGSPAAEPSRATRLGDALSRYSSEMPRFAEQPLSERQRLLAAGMRLCAVVAIELGGAASARRPSPAPGLAPAPEASAQPGAPSSRRPSPAAGTAPAPAASAQAIASSRSRPSAAPGTASVSAASVQAVAPSSGRPSPAAGTASASAASVQAIASSGRRPSAAAGLAPVTEASALPASPSKGRPASLAAERAAAPAAAPETVSSPATAAKSAAAGRKPLPSSELVKTDDGEDLPPLLLPLAGHPGIGPSTAEKLAARGLRRVIDALYFLPKRWDDLRQLVRVGQLQPGVLQSTIVVVERCRIVWARRRFLEAVLRGEDGESLLARWFYYVGGMQRRLQPGARFLLTGTPVRFRNVLQIVHPELTDLGGDPAAEGSKGPELGRVRVCYPDVEGVPARTVERLCQSLCQRYAGDVPDGIPESLLHKLGLPALPDSLRALHLSSAELLPAQLELLNQGLAPPQRRLIFEELFFLQLGLCQRRRSARVETATPCHAGPEVLARLRTVLPFTPTGAQERAIAELQRDLAQPHPMQRLLHGDVGSGKTLVAYAACEVVMAAGHQAALMAPTEILAEQHKKTLTPWATQTGRRIALLTATTPKTARKTTLALLQAGKFADVWRLAEESAQTLDRETILAMLAAGFLHLVIGTHALLAERVEFADLGLVVIDEQHRFGVAQRAALRKKGVMPHLLVMTATPIPRTLALTLYGDLDVTQLDELPPGRTPPLTRVLTGAAGEARAIAALGRAVATGRQAYWVCPLIEESDKIDLADATARHAALVDALPQCQVGLVHGRLNTDERDQVMERFRAGSVHVLVATTVIEVGVDVPNASLMVVESAERFGLAQLHQLRGRIGRGAGPSACLLLHHGGGSGQSKAADAGPSAESGDETGAAGAGKRARAASKRKPDVARDEGETPGESGKTSPPLAPLGAGTTARDRLEILARMSNGFHIAEADLRIRGPGEVLGTRQAGLPPLRYADLLRDLDLLQIARREAAALLVRDPDLSRPEHELMKRVLSERWASADITLE